jgi:hypothetical protein
MQNRSPDFPDSNRNGWRFIGVFQKPLYKAPLKDYISQTNSRVFSIERDHISMEQSSHVQKEALLKAGKSKSGLKKKGVFREYAEAAVIAILLALIYSDLCGTGL